MKLKEVKIMLKILWWPLRMILIILGIVPLTRCSSGYSVKDGKTMFNGKEITDKSFVVLSNEFAKDSTAVYYKERSFEFADVPTFVAVDEHFAKDKNKVYYCDEYREGQNYYMTKRQTISELKDVDPASFVSLQNGYGKDKKHAWYQENPFSVKDVGSITSIDRNFAKDNEQAYLNCKPIKGSNGRTFELLDLNFAKDSNQIYYYAFDGQEHYNICTIPCDIQSFKIIDQFFSKDKDKVFFLGYTLKDADPSSFEVLKSAYSKDKSAVYFKEKKMTGINPAAFKVYEENDSFNQDVVYAKDEASVYVNNTKIVGADVATFRLLGENYGADNTQVFYKTNLVKKAKPISFTVYPHDVGDADAEDGNNKFHEGIRVDQ